MTRGEKAQKKRVLKKWQGLHAHRYKNNPDEKRAALAWQELNKLDGRSRSMFDDLMEESPGDAMNTLASPRDRQVASTVVQWLGSPVGFAWLCDTFGLEVVRALQRRAAADGLVVEVGQVYRSLDSRDVKKDRRVTVERLRYGYGHPLYKTGPYAQWAVRSSTTSRLSYVQECHLLDATRWELVKGED